MTKNFINRVMSETIVDTKKYRYVYREGCIYRIELHKLDTMDSYTDWELVRDFR